jgi:hypothetical protein
MLVVPGILSVRFSKVNYMTYMIRWGAVLQSSDTRRDGLHATPCPIRSLRGELR